MAAQLMKQAIVAMIHHELSGVATGAQSIGVAIESIADRYVAGVLDVARARQAIGPLDTDWHEQPWRCPRCESEHVVVRDVRLPGGPPHDLRREPTVTYEAKCLDCDSQWRSTFGPLRIDGIAWGGLPPRQLEEKPS